MLPKHSNNETYLRKTAVKAMKDAKKANYEHQAKKTRAAEERSRQAKQQAEKLAAKAVRKAGVLSLAEQEKVKREFTKKVEQTMMEREYNRTIKAPNTNRLYAVKGVGGAWKKSAAAPELPGDDYTSEVASIDNVGNKCLGRIKAAEQSKRWSSSSLDHFAKEVLYRAPCGCCF